MFDEFLEDYKYNWKMADNQYTEERYRNSLSPKQVEKAQSSPTTSILLRIKWALKNLKMRIEAARFPEILAIAMIVFSISLILLIVSLGWNILTSETTLYRWSMTLYLVSGLLVLNLMPSTVAYNRKKYEKRSINDKHSMEEITKYFESVSVKALINTAEDFKIDLKNAVPWLILESQQYMKEKEKRQKENLLTQIVVTLLTITLSSVTNAIGDGTNEAIRRGAMVSSVCILILVSLVLWHYIKKHLEKANDEFQISKNLREALNYYANNLYKENPLTII